MLLEVLQIYHFLKKSTFGFVALLYSSTPLRWPEFGGSAFIVCSRKHCPRHMGQKYIVTSGKEPILLKMSGVTQRGSILEIRSLNITLGIFKILMQYGNGEGNSVMTKM